MMMKRFAVPMFSIGLGLMMLGAGSVFGGTYPDKPLRIVTTAPGSSVDFLLRLIAEGISDPFGQRVIIENRAGQAVPARTVAAASPDGYTLLGAASTVWLAPFIMEANYDPIRDFSPITLATRSPNILAVHPSLPVKSVNELIELAKAKQGQLNCAVTAIGGSIHLGAELLKAMTGVKIVIVPYKGVGEAVTGLMSGEVQLMFPPPASVSQHIASGRLRALAVTTAERSALVPGLPTVAASVPGFEATTMSGIWVPAKTPEAIVNRLNQEIVRFLNRPDVKVKLSNAGMEVIGSSPKDFAVTMKNDMSKWEKIIKNAFVKNAGIRAQ